MKVDINVLMIILLVVFLTSFVALIIYGEIWQIRLLTTDVPIESFDRARTQTTFIASCVSVGSGASMLYVVGTRFSKREKETK